MYAYKEPGEVSNSEAEAWYARTSTQTTDRGMEIRNARFVKDQYGRRMTHILQPHALAKEAGSLRTRFEGLQPASLQLIDEYGGGGDDNTPDTTAHSHTHADESSRTRSNHWALALLQLTAKHGSGTSDSTHTMANGNPIAGAVRGSRSDLVRLSRKTTVKRLSTRGNNTMAEKRSKEMSSTCSLAEDSSQNVTTQPTPVLPMTPRRFSFGEDSELDFSTIHRKQTIGLTNMRGRFPIHASIHTSTVQPYKESVSIARFLSLPLPPSQEPYGISFSSSGTCYHEFVDIDLSSSEVSQVAEKAGLKTVFQDVEAKQGPVPTTFDEILGKQKIPTALL